MSQTKLVAQPGLEVEQRLHTRRDLRHARRVCEHGRVGEEVLLLLLGPGVVVRHDPDQHVLAGRLGRLHFPPRDAAPPFVGDEAVAVRDDAHHHVALAGLALALGHRLAGQRAEALHHHGLLRQPQDRVVGHFPVGHQVLRGRREKDLHGKPRGTTKRSVPSTPDLRSGHSLITASAPAGIPNSPVKRNSRIALAACSSCITV